MLRRPSLNVGLTEQDIAEVTPTTLQAYLNSGGSAVKIIDLRPSDDYGKYSLPTSVSVSYHEDMSLEALATELHSELGKADGDAAAASAGEVMPRMLFVSAQSPDIDDLIARQVVNEHERIFGKRPPANSVGILVGGTAGYQEQFP